MRRFFRSLTLVVSVGLLCLVAVLAIIYYELPSARSLTAFFGLNRPRAIAPAPLPSQTNPNSQRPVAQNTSLAAPNPSAQKSENLIASRDRVGAYILGRFTEQKDADVQVCNQLDQMIRQNAASPGRKPADQRSTLMTSLEQRAERPELPDPILESVLAPLGSLLRTPSVSAVMQQMLAAADVNDPSLIQRDYFGAQMANAVRDVYTTRNQLNRVSQRAYHLYVLTQAASLQPRLVTTPAFRSMCQAIESRIESQAPESDVELEQEKVQLLALLASENIIPARVGYDPNLSSRADVELTSNGLNMRIPWIEKRFATNLILRSAFQVFPNPEATTSSMTTEH